MIRTRIAAVVLLAPALLATGCTSSSAKHHDSSTAPAGTSAAGVAASLRSGIDGLTSAAVTAHAGSVLDSLTGTLKLSNGMVTASDLVIGTGSAAATVITVGSTSYAKLPAGQNTSGKTWARVFDGSKNEFVRGLAPTLSVVQAATSLSGIADLVASGTGLKLLGSDTVGTVATKHYALTLHGQSGGSGLSSVLALAGANGVPAELWLDSAGRPVKVQFVLSSLNITAIITLTNFDAPVTITAPPKNDILEN